MKLTKLLMAAALPLGMLTVIPATTAAAVTKPTPAKIVHAQSLSVVDSDFCFQDENVNGKYVGENSGDSNILTATQTGCGGNEEFTLYENASPFYECLRSNWNDLWVNDSSADGWDLRATATGCGSAGTYILDFDSSDFAITAIGSENTPPSPAGGGVYTVNGGDDHIQSGLSTFPTPDNYFQDS